MYNPNEWRIAGIDKCEVNNGIGVGVTLFFQGCTHHCKECQNPSTWDFDGGAEFSLQTFSDLIRYCLDSNVKRLTLSGGDPLDNINFCRYISDWFKGTFPTKQLWIYTGYTFEQLISNNKYKSILNCCDVLVDGEYNLCEKDLSLAFRGSKNQRIIDVQKSLKSKETILYIE